MNDRTRATIDQLDPDLRRYGMAVPLATLTAHGLGPLSPPKGATAADRLARLASTEVGKLAAVDTAGSIGRMLLAVIGQNDGRLTAGRLAFETASADSSDIEHAVDRLCNAQLLHRVAPAGDLVLDGEVAGWWAGTRLSLADQHAMTSDALTLICRRHRVEPRSNKKQDKIEALAGLFDDPELRPSIMKRLSNAAVKMLTLLADLDGLRPVDVAELGVDPYQLRFATAPRFSSQPKPEDWATAALAELSWLGIVGVSDYERQAWIWSEAWPLLDRPVYTIWPRSPTLDVVARPTEPIRLPALVSQFEQAVRHWMVSPPPMLKNREHRLGKPAIRSTAKALSLPLAVIDLVSRLAMAIELLEVTPVSTSGSGRHRRTAYAWVPEPEAWRTWSTLGPMRKWMTFVAFWSRESSSWGDQLLANRLLLLWELALLDPDVGIESDEALMAWLEHRYQPVGVAEAGVEALADLRALDVVTTEGAVALTGLGRLVTTDFGAVESIPLGNSSHAVVQADMTIVAPPDLDPDLRARLATVAELESEAGASVYRLSETAIARAVQADETPASIADFLVELSSVPVDDTILRFVADAGAGADRVKIIEAPSVLVTSDPVDLTMACQLKSAKLTPVNATVALSALSAEKLRSVLAKKGLSPRLVVDASSRPEPRPKGHRADELERRAEQYRSMAARRNDERLREEAQRLNLAAEEARDPAKRWLRPFTFPTLGSFGAGLDRVEERPGS